MKIAEVTYFGIKGAKEPVHIRIESDLTVLCGRNDAGKSTTLQALEHFFNQPKIPENLLTTSTQGRVDEAWIEVTFSELPRDIVIDSTATTTFADEHLLIDEDRLKVRKTLNRSKSSYSLIANHPVEKESKTSLLAWKITELRTLVKNKGLDTSDISKARSSDLRKLLYQQHNLFEHTHEFAIPDKDNDAKSILDKIKGLFPEFHLFHAESISDESEKFIQDPVKMIVKDVIGRHISELGQIESKIVEELETDLETVAKELASLAPSLETTFSPSQYEPQWEKAFSSANFRDSNGIPLASRGSGMRRLALISFFKARAKFRNKNKDAIFAIEEPEVFLHPDLQREIWTSIAEQSNDPETQVIITTHSTNFIRETPVDSVRYVEGGKIKDVTDFGNDGDRVPGAQLVRAIEASMGLLSDNIVECFVLVEGRNDITMIEELCKSSEFSAYGSFAELFNDGRLLVMPIGGCGSIPLWDKGRLSPLNRPVIILKDGDESPEVSLDRLELHSLTKVCKVVLDCREPESLLSTELVSQAISQEWSLDINDVHDRLTRLRAQYADPSEYDTPAHCAQIFYEINPLTRNDSESDVEFSRREAKKFGSKESAAKKILARTFRHLDDSSTQQLKNSNLGLIFREIGSVLDTV